MSIIIIILSALFVVGYVLAFVNYFSYKRCSSSNNKSEQKLKEYSELLKEFEAENEIDETFKIGRDQMPPIK